MATPEKTSNTFFGDSFEPIGGFLVLVGLYLTSLYRYVLFHSLAEMFSIVIACGIFLVYWNSRRFLDNGYFLFVGIAYLCVGCLDLLHTLAYKGMGVFPVDGGNVANQLWIAARYLESASFVAACVFLHRRLNVRLVAGAYATAVALILGSIFVWPVFPACFLDGVGVTAFKTFSEIVICGILAASIALLVRRKADFDQRVFHLLVGSLALTIASELSFSFYTDPYGSANLIGHLFKLASFYLLYRAFIEEGLKRPFDLIFRELRCSEQELRSNKEETESLCLSLSKKQEFLNAVLDNIRDGIVACDAHGVLTLFNPATRRFHGLPEEPMPADQWPKHFSLHLADGVTMMKKEEVPLYRALRGEVVQNAEMVIVPQHGTPRRLLANGQQLIVDGELVGAVVVMHDITARKDAEDSLRVSKERLDLAVSGGELGLWDWNIQTGDQVMNELWARMLGYSLDEIRPTIGTWQDRIHPDDAKAVSAVLASHFANQTPYDVEFRMRSKSGDWVWIQSKGKVVEWDDKGRPLRMLGIHQDITARKDSADALAKAKEAAEISSRCKSEFLANMSHEIRTPMTAILGFADILLEQCATKQAAEAAQIIKRNGEHLLNVINDILDLSKIEAGKCSLDLLECSPTLIAAEVVALMKVRADAKGLPLTLEVQGIIPETVTTDPLRLRQILVNLVGNAIKFTEVGSVRVAMRLVETPEENAKLIFDVIDTGIGLSEEQTGLLFQPFSQADNSACRQFGGTGLGLAISKRMAGLLGGDILIRSKLGQGSVFSLSIGMGRLNKMTIAAEPGTTAAGKNSAGNAQHRLNHRILLVEDGPDNQRLIAFLLRKAGAEVTIADNGRIALDLALGAMQAGPPFAIILMDMQMPVMDGYEATRALRSAGYGAPIIALTAHAMAGDRQKCIDAGCDDYITKPIDATKLVGLVAAWVAATPSQCDHHAMPLSHV